MSDEKKQSAAEFSMPKKAKPSKALGRDGSRPHLMDAYVTPPNGDGKARLFASDAYKLVALDVEATGEFEPQFVPAAALKAAEKNGRFLIGEYVEPLDSSGHANGTLFRKPDHEKKPPDYDKLFADRKEPKREFVVGLNAKFLHDLAEAFGDNAVKLTFDADMPLGTILVEPLNSGRTSGQGRGLLMPIRLNV